MRFLPLSLVVLVLTAAYPVYAQSSHSSLCSFDLVDERGQRLPTFEKRGRTYVLGALGQRYLVRIRNNSGRRIEVVASVDGRDVIDGKPSSWDKRGYVLEPYGEVTVDGFRLDDSRVAAFRFSSVSRSYAAQMGDGRDVGVVGVAVFPERVPRYYSYWNPYPAPFDDGPSRAPSSSAPEAAPRSEAAGKAPAKQGPAPLEGRAEGHSRRPGLGTEFGEQHGSQVYSTHFERESSRPETVLSLRYNDRAGLRALGIDVDGPPAWAGETWRRETADPFRRNPGFSEPPPGWRP